MITIRYLTSDKTAFKSIEQAKKHEHSWICNRIDCILSDYFRNGTEFNNYQAIRLRLIEAIAARAADLIPLLEDHEDTKQTTTEDIA